MAGDRSFLAKDPQAPLIKFIRTKYEQIYTNICDQTLNDSALQIESSLFISTIRGINIFLFSFHFSFMAIDVVQKQMRDLTTKVDSLHSLVEKLSEQVSAIALVQDSSASDGAAGNGNGLVPIVGEVPPVVSAARTSMDATMSHKDILNDETYLEGDKLSNTSSMSPEIQIQRLTAQLTAAYNRMAVLEEQILACRFH